jgi:heterodisulfide reductase subunit A
VNTAQKHVAVIGAGVAGLTAADALAGQGVRVSLIEKTPFLGGHAIQLNCKATDACVKCGACLVEDKLRRTTQHANVAIFTDARIEVISGSCPYQLRYRVRSPQMDADRSSTLEADALLVTTGFQTFDPSAKPYGYGLFPNVITSLDAERILRGKSVLERPSDCAPAKRIAFIQCVGSRDASLGHSWCSKICCGSSMRMARLIQSRQEDVAITFFYIDVQTFGRDFQCVYQQARESITMIRSIPGEINPAERDELEVVYFDPHEKKSMKGVFDIVVLSVGLIPSEDNQGLAKLLDCSLDESGFMPFQGDDDRLPAGIFVAGAATGPMTIAESIGSAEKAVYDMMKQLG